MFVWVFMGVGVSFFMISLCNTMSLVLSLEILGISLLLSLVFSVSYKLVLAGLVVLVGSSLMMVIYLVLQFLVYGNKFSQSFTK